MTSIYPSGLSMSRDGNTSFDGIDVWSKFNDRSDVEKERMYSDEITHKKEDLPSGGTFNDNPEELQRIFDLEDTRFFFTYSKEKLNRLLNIGKKYMKDNNISEQDIEYMSWDLE